MGDGAPANPQDPPPFQGLYFPPAVGQRFCDDGLSELGQFGAVAEQAHGHRGVSCSSDASVSHCSVSCSSDASVSHRSVSCCSDASASHRSVSCSGGANVSHRGVSCSGGASVSHRSVSCSGGSGVHSGRSTGTCTSEDNGSVSGWLGRPLLHAPADIGAGRFAGGAGRGFFQGEGYQAKWHAAHPHPGKPGRGAGACEQKLDSFTDAFARRSPSVHPAQNGGQDDIFSAISRLAAGAHGRLDVAGLIADSSGPPPPLLLSPPPTPHSLPALSPPRRSHFPGAEAAQSAQPMQTDVPCGSAQFCAGLQAYYPPPVAQPALPPGKSLPLDWGPQSHDPAGNGHASYPHLQDEGPDPPALYPGDGEYGLRRVAFSPQEVFRSADPCNLQTPLSSPQGHYPQSSVSFPPDHNPMTSTDHVISWSQASERGLPMTHNHHLPPCSMLSLPHPQSDGFRPVDAGSQATVSGAQCPTKVKSGSCLSYAGLPFPSVLQTGRAPEAPGGPPHYSPRPMLNPIRRGTGLYCSLLPLPCLQSHFSEQQSPWPEETCLPLPKVNLGPEFQAEVPRLLECRSHDHWPEESPMEQLLWKPWEDLEDSNDLQDQVENLLDLCSSSAMPGGGTNLELALHCLSRCQGDMLATVEMLLLSSPPSSSSSSSSSSEDYHYSGSAVWTLSEKRLLNKAFVTHSKDFSLIQKMVKTKSVSQCVEFYYLSRKVLEQQRRQQERERVAKEERSAAGQTLFPISHTLVTPVPMEEPIQSPSLAANFPCKQCGKMFYKIKSRNAHMKIHRQQQEDWRERGRPSPILTHSLAQSLPQNQARLTYLQPTGNHTGAVNHAGPSAVSNALSNALLAPQHQTWDPFDLTLDSGTFYFNSDGKVVLGMAGAPKSQISWQ